MQDLIINYDVQKICRMIKLGVEDATDGVMAKVIDQQTGNVMYRLPLECICITEADNSNIH